MFRLKIKTDNSAFENRGYSEVARILREVADRIDHGERTPIVQDVNGNTVGKVEWPR